MKKNLQIIINRNNTFSEHIYGQLNKNNTAERVRYQETKSQLVATRSTSALDKRLLFLGAILQQNFEALLVISFHVFHFILNEVPIFLALDAQHL